MKIPPRSSPCLVSVVVVGSLKETIIIVRCCFVIVLIDSLGKVESRKKRVLRVGW
jgi:hypothetical protein